MGYTDYTWPGKHTKNDGKSPFLMGISTISMAIFQFTNCKRLPGRVLAFFWLENSPKKQREFQDQQKPGEILYWYHINYPLVN